MKILYEDTFLIIKFDDQLKLMYTSWTGYTTDFEEQEIKRLINIFVNFLDEYKPNFILADDSKRSSVYPVEVQKWVANTIAKGAVRANVSKYAIILPQDLISSLSTEQVVDEVIDMPFELQYFENEENAKNWFFL